MDMMMNSNTCEVEFYIECGLNKYLHLSGRGDGDKDVYGFIYYV